MTQGVSLHLQNVGAFRGDQQIFMDISLEIRPNEFIGILGPSGSGKSTLLEILTLGGRLSEGGVRFDKTKDLHDHAGEYVASLGYVPQDDVLTPMLTVRETLWYAARLRMPGVSAKEIDDAVEAMLRRFGLDEHRNKRIATLSGGQRKRVSIAMELFRKPRLLILDEPTSGLDPAMEKSVMEDLRKIADDGTTVICSTHVMESLDLFDRVAVIGQQKTLDQDAACGDLDFFETPRLLKEFYGVDDFAALYRLLKEDPYIVHLPTARPVPRRATSPLGTLNGLLSTTPRRKLIAEIADIFRRTRTVFRRDLFLPALSLLLPPVLGSLIVLSQGRESNIRPMLFFAIIVTLWFGMNNSVRSVVGQRRLYARENLAGLSMHGFLLGTASFYLVLGVVQVALLWTTLALGSGNDDFGKVALPLAGVLFFSYICGLGLGMLVSTLAGSENVAIAWVPLLIMPQILLSAIAAGNSADDFDDPRRLAPIAYAREAEPIENDLSLRTFKTLSLLCYSRPASSLLEFPIRNIDDAPAYRTEWLYFAALAAATWAALWLAFALRSVNRAGRR